jgi:hypothetical protein
MKTTPAFTEGQEVIWAGFQGRFAREAWEDFQGKTTYVIAFQAGRNRLLELPADAESIRVEAVAR